jgi:hypothetical protein
MHGVMAPALCEHHQISLFILDQTKVLSRDGIGNSIMDAFDAHNFGTKLLKQ